MKLSDPVGWIRRMPKLLLRCFCFHSVFLKIVVERALTSSGDLMAVEVEVVTILIGIYNKNKVVPLTARSFLIASLM